MSLLLALGVLSFVAATGICALYRWPRATLSLCAVAAVAMLAGWNALLQRHRLDFVPEALRVTEILYAKEESWGFGPGGNETGVIAYQLPDDIAAHAASEGTTFFANLPPTRKRTRKPWQGRFEHWRPTPLDDNGRWERDQVSRRFRVEDYVCAYGFCIEIDPDQRRRIEAAVNAPGSHYAYGRIGVIVVVPAQRRVYFLYNG